MIHDFSLSYIALLYGIAIRTLSLDNCVNTVHYQLDVTDVKLMINR